MKFFFISHLPLGCMGSTQTDVHIPYSFVTWISKLSYHCCFNFYLYRQQSDTKARLCHKMVFWNFFSLLYSLWIEKSTVITWGL